EVEHGVAQDPIAGAHRYLHPDAGSHADGAATSVARPARANTEPDAASRARRWTLDSLRSHDCAVSPDQLSVLEAIAAGVDLHPPWIGQHHVVGGDRAAWGRRLRLEGKGGGRACAQAHCQREQSAHSLHCVTPRESTWSAAAPPEPCRDDQVAESVS